MTELPNGYRPSWIGSMNREQQVAILKLYGLTSLQEATEDNWPWFIVGHYEKQQFGPNAHFPDFHKNDSAAVTLAEKMAHLSLFPTAKGWGVRIPNCEPGPGHRDYHGETLWAALLAALVADEVFGVRIEAERSVDSFNEDRGGVALPEGFADELATHLEAEQERLYGTRFRRLRTLIWDWYRHSWIGSLVMRAEEKP